MNNIIKFFIGLNLLLLLSCSSDKQKEISILNEDEIEMQMIVAYNEGLDALNEGDWELDQPLVKAIRPIASKKGADEAARALATVALSTVQHV